VDNVAEPAYVRFVPDRRYTVVAGVGMVGAALAAALTGDAAGRVLFTVAAAVLLCYVASDVVFSPRLIASRAGIAINAPLTRVILSWDDVIAVRAETRFRRGLRSATLEIDADPVLAVFSRRTLGVEPAQAAARIEAVRPR
jgi:predicted anti-sigma-YlaC factor YlaD